MTTTRITKGTLLIVWDGTHALPAIALHDFNAHAQMWAPEHGLSLTVVAPHEAAGNVSIDAALRGDFALRAASDDMDTFAGGDNGEWSV